jgi:alpha-tubulin suppressor-like RCC1 family protein
VNTFGQLGNGTTVDSATPVAVSSLTGVQEISFGGNNVDDGHVLALLDDGTVVAWGCNASGQLGDTTTTDSSVPVTVAGLSGIVAVAAGGSHSMALDNTGTLWTWGDNTYGQLGDSSTVDSSAPIDVLADVTLFSAGSEHSIAYQTG